MVLSVHFSLPVVLSVHFSLSVVLSVHFSLSRGSAGEQVIMNKFVLNSADSYPKRSLFRSETSTKWFSVFRVFDSAKSCIPEASSPDEFLGIVVDISDKSLVTADIVDTGTSPWTVL